MFESFKNFFSDKLNEMKIQSFEKNLEENNLDANEFDDDFYDWSKIAATYSNAGRYFFTYK